MITTTQFDFRTVRATCAILAACTLVGLASPAIPTARALPFTLADGNSYINIETNNQATVYDWYVEDPLSGVYIDHLKELSNWYRVDVPFGVPTGPETSVSTLFKVSQVATDTNPFFDNRPDTLTVLYRDVPNHFEMRIIYNITGGGPLSGLSGLDEEIRIFNTAPIGGPDLEIHVFEYVDLDLHDTPGDDRLRLTGPNGLHQRDPYTDFVGSIEVDRHEIDQYPITLNKLQPPNINVDDLASVWPAGAGPVFGDVAWALQWDFVGPPPPPPTPPGVRHRIAPRQFAFIHKEGILQMHDFIVPEPASAVLAALGTTALFLRRRRRTAQSPLAV